MTVLRAHPRPSASPRDACAMPSGASQALAVVSRRANARETLGARRRSWTRPKWKVLSRSIRTSHASPEVSEVSSPKTFTWLKADNWNWTPRPLDLTLGLTLTIVPIET